jgi:hypothetical protein
MSTRLIAWGQRLVALARVDPNTAPVAILTAMPLLMAMFGREWLYTPIRYLDPWYNVGFFQFYHDASFLTNHYKVQRLPWILPGWLLYHLLGPLFGNFVLHVGALITSTIFVYLALARLVARQSALLVAAFLTIYIPFHGSGAWDYQAAGAGAYYALTFYLVIRASQAKDPRKSLIAAGAAYAGAVFATINLINFLPVVASLYFVVGERHRTTAGIRTAIQYSLIGFGGLTLALCVINLMVGRSFLFFWPLLQIVIERMSDPAGQKPWWLPWSAFFVPPGEFLYLVFPASVLAASLLRLIFVAVGLGPLNLVRAFLLAQYVFLALLWVLWQQLGHTALSPDYFAHSLIIPAFLALGSMLGGNSASGSRLTKALLAGGLLLSLVPAVQGAFGPLLAPMVRELSEVTAVVWLGVVAVTVLLVAVVTRGIVLAVLMLACVAAFTFGYLSIQAAWPRFTILGVFGERYWQRDGCLSQEQSFREIVRLFRVFRSENPVIWQTWLWRGPSGERTFGSCTLDLDLLRGSVHSTGVSNLGVSTDTHPSQIGDDYLNYVVDRGLVVAMVQDEKDADGLIERFAIAGKN